MFRSQTDPGARPLTHLLLARLASGGIESIARVARKAAGKIATIVGIVLAFHRDLFAVVKLRDAAHAEGKRDVHHRALKRRAVERHETRRVVIVCERRYLRRDRDKARRISTGRAGLASAFDW